MQLPEQDFEKYAFGFVCVLTGIRQFSLGKVVYFLKIYVNITVKERPFNEVYMSKAYLLTECEQISFLYLYTVIRDK